MENSKTTDTLITVEVKSVRQAKRLYTLARITFGVSTFIVGVSEQSLAGIIAFAILMLGSVFIEAAADERLDSLHDFFKVCVQRMAIEKTSKEDKETINPPV